MKRSYLMVACLMGWLLVPGETVHAGGLEIPGGGLMSNSRGGAFMVRADDPTATIHNPGGLSRLSGTHLLYNHTLNWSHIAFTRAQTGLNPGIDYGFDPLATVENQSPLFPLGAMLMATTDFGLEDWTFALGASGPNASGASEYPVEGGQRYMLTKMDAFLAYLSLGVAYGHEDVFGVGVTLQYVVAPWVKLSMVVDASPFGGELNAYYSGNDVVANIELGDWTGFSAIVGAWWRVIPELEIAVSGRVVPIYLNMVGDITLSNAQGAFTESQLLVTDSSASMDLVLPPTAQVGLRYRYLDGDREWFDMELNVVYEAWSMLDEFHVDLEGEINLFTAAQAQDQVIAKNWRDTLSVRFGGTVNVLEDQALSISVGGFWESAAVPENYENLDFLSFDRIGLAFGIAGRIGPVSLGASYTHVFQEDREVTEQFGKVSQLRPLSPCPDSCGLAPGMAEEDNPGWTGVPANAGRFESGYDMVTVGIEVTFGGDDEEESLPEMPTDEAPTAP